MCDLVDRYPGLRWQIAALKSSLENFCSFLKTFLRLVS